MEVTSEASQKALDARTRMLELRPKDAISPLPGNTVELDANCEHYFEVASFLYAKAAEAFQLGDTTNGLIYELYAYEHMQIGHACLKQGE